MSKTTSNPAGVPSPLRPYYANAVRVEPAPLLFISGQVAWDVQGRIVGVRDPAKQARQAFANLGNVLRAHGIGYGDVVKVTMYVTDLSWFEELSSIRVELFASNPPASTLVVVKGLVHQDLLVEVDAVAVLPTQVFK